jgi:uncharacterized protein YutE (UPF0331/DUF86 family)
MSELDVVLSKINIVKNCLMALEKASKTVSDANFQISIYEINLQRAIQACIDLANIIIAKEGLGLPNTYRQSFEILFSHQIINEEMKTILCKMVGFRNISVHDYGQINPEIVRSLVQNHIGDFETFYTLVFKRAEKW